MTQHRLKLNRQTKQQFGKLRRLKQLKEMDPITFEHFVGYLYQKQGYAVFTTAASGDEGVDLFLKKGLQTAVVQCKRYSGTVGQSTVRDLYGAMIHTKARRAVLVTSGTISHQAEVWARGKPIDLIDGHELISWARGKRGGGYRYLAALRGWVIGFMVLALLAGLFYVGAGSWVSSGETAETPTPGKEPGSGSAALIQATSLRQGDLQRQIVLDGDVGDWSGIRAYETPHRVAATDRWDGHDDAAAAWRLAWDRSHLYVAVVIEDDVLQASPDADGTGDGLVLWLDRNILGDYAPGLNRDDYKLILSPGDFAKLPPTGQTFRGNRLGALIAMDDGAIMTAARQTGSGYVLEAMIPWTAVQITAAENLQVGVALDVLDRDRANTQAPEAIYSHVPNRQADDPTTWGTLILAP